MSCQINNLTRVKLVEKCNQLTVSTTTTTRTERDKLHNQGQNDASVIYVFREISQIALYICKHKYEWCFWRWRKFPKILLEDWSVNRYYRINRATPAYILSRVHSDMVYLIRLFTSCDAVNVN